MVSSSPMPTCPVCENVQEAGDECAVCGHPLAGGAERGARVEFLEGLEPTVLGGAAEAGDSGERLEGLEPTEFPPAEGAGSEAVELEPTRTGAVEALVETMEGLEPTAEAGVPDEPDLEPPPPTCRYCRAALPTGGTFCPRCGMRASRPIVARPEGAADPALCASCGTPVRGAVCRACGARVAG